MSKDPAFLFYSGDFLVGTALFTETEVGQYVRLMCFIHQSGRITKEDMYNICPNISPRVISKFKTDETGRVYNERLDVEIEKRKKYSESRRKNRFSKKEPDICQTHVDTHVHTYDESYVPHMENGNGNGNGNIIDNKRKEVQEETIEDKLTYALDNLYLNQQATKWGHIDFPFEVESFKNKVRGSPDHYKNHDTGGIRLALQSQLRNAKSKRKDTSASGNKSAGHINSLVEGFKRRHGGAPEGG